MWSFSNIDCLIGLLQRLAQRRGKTTKNNTPKNIPQDGCHLVAPVVWKFLGYLMVQFSVDFKFFLESHQQVTQMSPLPSPYLNRGQEWTKYVPEPCVNSLSLQVSGWGLSEMQLVWRCNPGIWIIKLPAGGRGCWVPPSCLTHPHTRFACVGLAYFIWRTELWYCLRRTKVKVKFLDSEFLNT